MNRSDELAMLLRVEAYFCEHYHRQYDQKKIEYAAACKKIERCIASIQNWKTKCVQELEADDYPEEYYLPLPAIPVKEPHKPAIPELQIKNEYQMSIADFLGGAVL